MNAAVRSTWESGDPQPGRDVTAVRTAAGWVYNRHWQTAVDSSEFNDVWVPVGHEGLDAGLEWGELLVLGLLVDVTRPRPVADRDAVVHSSHRTAVVPTPYGTTYYCRLCGKETVVRRWRSATGEPGATEVGTHPCVVAA